MAAAWLLASLVPAGALAQRRGIPINIESTPAGA